MKKSMLALIKSLEPETRDYLCVEKLGNDLYLLEDLDIKYDKEKNRPFANDCVLNIKNVPVLSHYHLIAYCQDELETNAKNIGMYQGKVIAKPLSYQGGRVKIPLLIVETQCVSIADLES